MQVRPWGLLLLLNCLFLGINQEITVTITTVMCPRQDWTLNLPLELEKWTWHWKNVQFSFIDIASKIIRWLWSSKIALHIFLFFFWGGLIILHKFPDAASRLITLFETPLVVGWQVVQGLAMASFSKKAVSQICQIFAITHPLHHTTVCYNPKQEWPMHPLLSHPCKAAPRGTAWNTATCCKNHSEYQGTPRKISSQTIPDEKKKKGKKKEEGFG